MIAAAQLAQRGEAHGTVIVAEEQTEGVGRQGHSWHSEPGAGLYLSIILRMQLPPDVLPILTMALGLAVQEAVNEFAEVSCDLRWPNDVLLNEKKMAGAMIQQPQKKVLVAGIGINVNHVQFPEDLRELATSLRIETGKEFAKEPLLDLVVAKSMLNAEILARGGKARILKRVEECSSYVRGKSVDVEGGVRGITAGLNADGFLLVKTETGMETILTGGVRPAR